jgi:hypothetical protein
MHLPLSKRDEIDLHWRVAKRHFARFLYELRGIIRTIFR